MSVRIDVVGDDAALEDLWEWLLAERGLRGRIRLDSASPRPGTMGSGLGIAVELSNLGLATVNTLVAAIGVWLAHRPVSRGGSATPAGTVTVTLPDGTRYEISHGDTAELERLSTAISRHLLHDDDPAA
ncbi:hypothetical protein [Streptomyces sp. NPDC059165]|uniref:effector-associated constant component EACC1 n=1 Tax=Streptomyces sp. NPDC059165 TaxID=3346751 RepID=UPI0036771E34